MTKRYEVPLFRRHSAESFLRIQNLAYFVQHATEIYAEQEKVKRIAWPQELCAWCQEATLETGFYCFSEHLPVCKSCQKDHAADCEECAERAARDRNEPA